MRKFLSKLFPRVTTSREEFIEHIILTCEARDINEEKKLEWVKKVRRRVSVATYFWGMIFTEKASFRLLSHELSHHIIEHIRIWTVLKMWGYFHFLSDDLYCLIYLRKKGQ